MAGRYSFERLANHDRAGFSCGSDTWLAYLKRQASQDRREEPTLLRRQRAEPHHADAQRTTVRHSKGPHSNEWGPLGLARLLLRRWLVLHSGLHRPLDARCIPLVPYRVAPQF